MTFLEYFMSHTDLPRLMFADGEGDNLDAISFIKGIFEPLGVALLGGGLLAILEEISLMYMCRHGNPALEKLFSNLIVNYFMHHCHDVAIDYLAYLNIPDRFKKLATEDFIPKLKEITFREDVA